MLFYFPQPSKRIWKKRKKNWLRVFDALGGTTFFINYLFHSLMIIAIPGKYCIKLSLKQLWSIHFANRWGIQKVGKETLSLWASPQRTTWCHPYTSIGQTCGSWHFAQGFAYTVQNELDRNKQLKFYFKNYKDDLVQKFSIWCLWNSDYVWDFLINPLHFSL